MNDDQQKPDIQSDDAKTEPRLNAISQDGRPAPLFLQTLICPVTRGLLTYDKARSELISKAAGLAFPVRDGVPIMLEDEARELSEAEMK